ncbi:hypothetical protein C9J85_05015 [Haloferax sp. wsp5]|nr:hypothetical protein C9J85_05015 [Haloferax sp. wsp5]
MYVFAAGVTLGSHRIRPVSNAPTAKRTPIQKDEVKLVCWMVVAPEEDEKEERPSTGLISQTTL